MAYFEIFEGVVSSIAASSIFTPAKVAVERYMSTHKKNVKKEESDKSFETLVAVPLAIGYHYNLIKKLDKAIYGSTLEVKKHVRDSKSLVEELNLTADQINNIAPDRLKKLQSLSEERTEFLGLFNSKQVMLELIYPKDLSNPSLRQCSDYLFDHTDKGSIEMDDEGRPYGINYVLENDKIKIVDYIRPVEAIPKFYTEMKGMGTLAGVDKDWKEIEEREMNAFLYAIMYMTQRHTDVFYDKVYFKPLDTIR